MAEMDNYKEPEEQDNVQKWDKNERIIDKIRNTIYDETNNSNNGEADEMI